LRRPRPKLGCGAGRKEGKKERKKERKKEDTHGHCSTKQSVTYNIRVYKYTGLPKLPLNGDCITTLRFPFSYLTICQK
jgi:hypothetical protein